MKLTISIDDVHPQKGWRILGDKTEKWLRNLNEEFGTKFTLFIPSNYHQKYPLTDHISWVDELVATPYVEVAAHGHFHQCLRRKDIGECEFFELETIDECRTRLHDLWLEWMAVGYLPNGWRTPGWLMNPDISEMVGNSFKYVAAHYEHNRGINWGKSQVLYGHDGIQQSNIEIHNTDMIMYTSHIAGSWNHNVWSDDNFEQLQLSLSHLVELYDIEFKTLGECIDA